MRAKTELLLWHLLWAAEMMMRPTFRNLMGGYEGWAYRNGFLKEIQRLEAKGIVELTRSPLDHQRLVRLTQAGRELALGGRDPQASWEKVWDNKWRLVLFDLPADNNRLRRQVLRALAAHGFGCLQGSVWISPQEPPELRKVFKEQGRDCSHFMVLEADSKGAKVDRKMVAAAWDFERINELYAEHMEVLGRWNAKIAASQPALLAWSTRENVAWLKAIRNDPLLPKALLPRGYVGRKAWNRRGKIMKRAAAVLTRGQGIK